MIYCSIGSESTTLSPKDLKAGLYSSLEKLGARKKVFVVPPDFTRFHSGAGELTSIINWRQHVVTIGTVPAEYVTKITNGAVNYSWPAQLNKLVNNGGHDLILSVGQVVPLEVMGMANYNKTLLIGTGWPEGICLWSMLLQRLVATINANWLFVDYSLAMMKRFSDRLQRYH